MTLKETEPANFDPRLYITIFIFRWKIIALCLLLSVALGAVYIAWVPVKYRTECKVMIWRDPALAVSSRDMEFSDRGTYMMLFTGEELQRGTEQKLEKKWLEKMGSHQRKKVEVTAKAVQGHKSIMSISIEHANSEYAEDYLNTLWEEFLTKQDSMRKDSSGAASKKLENELAVLESSIEKSEEDLMNYSRVIKLDLTTAESTMENQYLMGLLLFRNRLNTELGFIEAMVPRIEEEDVVMIHDTALFAREVGQVQPVGAEPKAVAGSMSDSREKAISSYSINREVASDTPEVLDWESTKTQLVNLELKEKNLLEKFLPEHTEVRQVQNQIAELRDRLKLAAQTAFGRLQERRKDLQRGIEALDVSIRTWRQENADASQKRAAYQRRALKIGRREASYQDLASRLNELKISEEMRSDHLVLWEPVETDERPVWPDPAKILIMALVIGFASGFGGALMLHIFDNKMQTIGDVEKVLGVPFLGGVPHWVRKGQKDSYARPIVLEEYSSGAVEAYRVLRTSILSALDKSGRNVVLFTSAESREGKTLTVLNIAVMIAMVGKKVLLVDMDLRRPRLHRSLGQDLSPGVTDAFAAGKKVADVAKPTSIDNLWFVSGGSSCKNAAELLQAHDLVEFFASAREQYDYILMDTSPVLRTADTSILCAPELCAVVYIAHVNRTPKPLIRYSLDILGNAHVLGLVMNNIEMNRINSIYYSYQYPNYAYYSHAYSYGCEYDYYYSGDRRERLGRKRHTVRTVLLSLGQHIQRALLPMK